jgi:hypothetical protein
MEEEATVEQYSHDKFQALDPAWQIPVRRPCPTHLLQWKFKWATQQRRAIWQRLVAVEKSQQAFRKQFEKDRANWRFSDIE